MKRRNWLRILGISLITGVCGMVVGYFIFAKVGGEYVPLSELLRPAQSLWLEIKGILFRIVDIRNNILICGGTGSAGGFILSALVSPGAAFS